MNALEIRDLSKQYSGEPNFAVKELRLDVSPGMLCALVGESGSGKSTLLRLIAGLETPNQGEIKVGDKMVASRKINLPPEKRKVGLVFQDSALFPHLTVKKNIAFGLRKNSKPNQNSRVEELLKLVGLKDFKNKYPSELSGGEAQRVALARALAPNPRLLLLDEPFSSLDPTLRKRLREDVKDILKATSTTALFVTHDSHDAMAIGERVVIMREGKILQIGEPAKLYRNPYDAYCANLFGPINRVPGHLLQKDKPENKDESTFFWVRPEDIEVIHEQEADRCIKVDIKDIVYQGEYQEARVNVDPIHGDQTELTIRIAPETKVSPGQSVWVRMKD